MVADLSPLASLIAADDVGALGLIGTALVLGIRHGFDWDHLAAITDVTSTTATAEHAEHDHEAIHAETAQHDHQHGGPAEVAAHGHEPAASEHPHPAPTPRLIDEQKRAMLLGTLYALGHAAVVAVLGILALSFGAILPDWVDTVMGPVVGATLVFLGV